LSALAHRHTPVLHKPFRSEALHGAIRKVLKSQAALTSGLGATIG